MTTETAASGPTPEIVDRAAAHGPRRAVIADGAAASYEELVRGSAALARALLGGHSDLDGERVCYLVPPSPAHVVTQWAIWRAGGIAVPLATSWPAPEIARVLDDAEPTAIVAAGLLADRVAAACEERDVPLLSPSVSRDAVAAARGATGGDPGADGDDEEGEEGEDCEVGIHPASESPRSLPRVAEERPALMIYTSGTTGRPKGVVTTHANIRAQITTLVEAWDWRPQDRILHVLPLHHVHGVINALSCALWVGAACEFRDFDARAVWERLASGEVTVFMAVPTIYDRLLTAWESAQPSERRRWSRAEGLRLMVSGSAALPVATLERWQEITGHRLLERYGMTEIGMALSNPLEGERRAGTVGRPLPGVRARLVDESGAPVREGAEGEIEIRGPQVFREYWRRPGETEAAFRDGWFRTGDIALVEEGYWRILGRSSVDIVKTGGYKVSALEVEEVLREHPAVADAAVVGVEDPRWGERLCGALLSAGEKRRDPESIREWCKERMAPYKVPKELVWLEALPRNAMGKVVKPELRALFAAAD